jgi:hypothetical protein
VSTETTADRDARIAAEITAHRMARIERCGWASPEVMDVLAEYAADLRPSIPLSVELERIRRVIEADRDARRDVQPEERHQAVRLAS